MTGLLFAIVGWLLLMVALAAAFSPDLSNWLGLLIGPGIWLLYLAFKEWK